MPPPPSFSGRRLPSLEWALGAFLFVATLLASSQLNLAHKPLRFLGGITDEWFALGCNVAYDGTLGIGERPIVLRAPGYPFFIAAVLRATASKPERYTRSFFEPVLDAVCLVQCVLLAAACAWLYGWLLRRTSVGVAFTAALLFGLNPYSLLLPGLLHYDVLHLFLLIVSTSLLERLVSRGATAGIGMLGIGVVWGLTTLVRPVSLLLPPFVLLLLVARHRRAWKRAIAGALVLTAGMFAAIAPWTARNHAVTGRWIPVSLQAWSALWGSTVAPLGFDPDRYHWHDVGVEHLLPIFRRVTGAASDNYRVLIDHNLELEAAFRDEALRNIRERPFLYARNVLRSLLTLTLQINSSLVSVFQRTQRPGVEVSQAWFWGPDNPEREATPVSRGVSWLFGLLTILAAAGALRSLSRGDVFALTLGLVCGCVCLTHALIYMDYMYYYVKLPFLMGFAALGLDWLEGRELELRAVSRRVRVVPLLCVGLVAWCVALTLVLLWS